MWIIALIAGIAVLLLTLLMVYIGAFFGYAVYDKLLSKKAKKKIKEGQFVFGFVVCIVLLAWYIIMSPWNGW